MRTIVNLIDFEKCSKTRIYWQRSVPIQPKTSDILPKICQQRSSRPLAPRDGLDLHLDLPPLRLDAGELREAALDLSWKVR